MRICVISDVHFKYIADRAEDLENSRIVLSFLREAAGNYDLLVLNGDIFDLWFDWKYTLIKQYFPLLHRLAEIHEQGCRLVLISGNHDFWFNNFLPEYLGVEIHDSRYTLEADGKRMLFTHGDLHTVNDLRYKVLRKVIRLRGMKWLFSILHPDLALWIGKKMSRSSRLRRISSILQNQKVSGMLDYASKQIAKRRFDLVVMGHSHHPILQEQDGGTYANSGDWMLHHSYVEIIDGQIELKKYTLKENQS